MLYRLLFINLCEILLQITLKTLQFMNLYFDYMKAILIQSNSPFLNQPEQRGDGVCHHLTSAALLSLSDAHRASGPRPKPHTRAERSLLESQHSSRPGSSEATRRLKSLRPRECIRYVHTHRAKHVFCTISLMISLKKKKTAPKRIILSKTDQIRDYLIQMQQTRNHYHHQNHRQTDRQTGLHLRHFWIYCILALE